MTKRKRKNNDTQNITQKTTWTTRAGQSSFSKGLLKIIKNRNYDGLKARKHNIRV